MAEDKIQADIDFERKHKEDLQRIRVIAVLWQNEQDTTAAFWMPM